MANQARGESAFVPPYVNTAATWRSLEQRFPDVAMANFDPVAGTAPLACTDATRCPPPK